MLAVFTIWAKALAGLSDILHHAVGEMARRARGGALAPSISQTDAPANPQVAPLRRKAPRPPSKLGGQEEGPLLHHKPWIQAEGEEEDRVL